jgi:hypothetical protein
MQNPSLVVVPYRYKATKLYSEIPITGVGDFTVGRLLNTATRVNSNGNIEVVNANIPRLDYYTTGGVAGCPALLVEPSADNVARQSAGLDVSGTWQRTNISVTTGIISLDGNATAFEIVESSDVTAQTHELAQTGFSVVSGTAYTFSLFIKAGTNNRNLRLAVGGANFVGNPVAIFNPVSGTIVASGDCVASIENYGNGWFRCRITATADLNGSSFLGIYTASGTSVSYIGNGSGSVQVWGAQAETGSVATSYIPTTTGSVTRNADVISLTGVSGLIGQSEGTLYAEVVLSRVNPNQVISLGTPGASNDRIMIFFDSSTGISALIRVGASNVDYNVTIPAIPATGGVYKIALAYKANDYCFAVNGVAYPSTASRGVPANMSAVYLGASVFSTGQLNDRIRAAALYTSRLDDADLMVLTSPTYYSNVRDMIWDTFVARTSTFSELPGCLQTRHNELITL